MTFKATLATVITEVVKEGEFASLQKPMSDELHRFISKVMDKAGKRKSKIP